MGSVHGPSLGQCGPVYVADLEAVNPFTDMNYLFTMWVRMIWSVDGVVT